MNRPPPSWESSRLPTTPRGVQNIPSMVSPRSQGIPAVDTINTMNTMMTEATGSGDVIFALTQRLADKESEVRALAQQNQLFEIHMNQHQGGNSQAYDTLLAHYMEREESLCASTELNQGLTHKLQEMEKLVRQLQNSSAVQRAAMREKEEKLNKLIKGQEEKMGDLKKKDDTIAYLNMEKDEMIARAKESRQTEKKLRDEIAGYEDLVAKSKSLAEGQIHVLLENEKAMGGLETEKATLQKDIDSLKEAMKKDAHTIKSKDALLNMQRQEMTEKQNLVQMYETKFQAKDLDVPKMIARANEGERIWAKIEERTKKFTGKEMIIEVLRSEKVALEDDKKKLTDEVVELKKCFDMYDLKLKGTNDKVHMPWLLSQLRDSVQLKERVVELEEIIKGEGYTVKAAEAEADFKKMGGAISLEMEKVTPIIATLKAQAASSQDLEVPILLGKLEECLLVFGHDIKKSYKPLNDVLSTASSDIGQSMSLNTAESYDEKWVKSTCITPRDFRDLMHPTQYRVVTNLADGFSSLHNEGLCSQYGQNQEEEAYEDEDDVDEEGCDLRDDDDISLRTEAPSVINDEQDDSNEEVEGETTKPDIHLEKVLKVIQQEDDELLQQIKDKANDWRSWISPPTSPRCRVSTAAAE